MDKKTRYQQLKSAGLCVECGKTAAISNSVYCEECRKAHRTKNKLYRTRLYYKRVDNRECVDCGVKLPSNHYYIKCAECRAKQKEYYRRKHEQRKQSHNNRYEPVW